MTTWSFVLNPYAPLTSCSVWFSLTSLYQYGLALWLNLLVGRYFSACLNADINISFTKSGLHLQLSIDNIHFKLLTTEYLYCSMLFGVHLFRATVSLL